MPDAAPLETRVAACVVHYRTPDLLDAAIRTFAHHYPRVRVLVIDNGSGADVRPALDALAASVPTVDLLVLEANEFHGPAMHRAMRALETPYVFFLDSDTETRRGGFLEALAEALDADPDAYAAGEVARVNERGFAGGTIPVPVSAHMLIRGAHYRVLPAFEHHGLPVLANMRAAQARGLKVVPVPVARAVWHKGRGTAERFGYGLGWRSRLDFLLNRLGW